MSQDTKHFDKFNIKTKRDKTRYMCIVCGEPCYGLTICEKCMKRCIRCIEKPEYLCYLDKHCAFKVFFSKVLAKRKRMLVEKSKIEDLESEFTMLLENEQVVSLLASNTKDSEFLKKRMLVIDRIKHILKNLRGN